MWGLAWNAHALWNGLPLFDANYYFPEADALRFNEHFLGLSLVALPFQWIGGPVFAYWIVWLLSFPLNGVAMYALAWRVTGDRLASFLAGLIYAFCFFRMHHAHGHLLLLWTFALPLIPLAIEGWLAAPTWRATATVTALVVFQSLVSWYLAVLTALVGVVSAVGAGFSRPAAGADFSRPTINRFHVLRGAAAALLGGGLLAWLAVPYLSLQPGGVAEAAALSADLKGYLVPPFNTLLGQQLPSLEPREIWGERTIYAGWTTLGLGLAGIAVALRKRTTPLVVAIAVIGAVALALSFGPSATGWSPYDLLAQIPGLSLLRAPARLSLLVMLALAVFAAIGFTAIASTRGPAARALLLVIVALAVLVESFVVKFPGGKPKPFLTPPVYAHLATLPPGPVLSLPTYRQAPDAFRDSDYLFFSMAHWRPIVNGYGRQEPPSHGELMDTVKRFPAAAAIERLRAVGVRYVVMNGDRASELRPAIDAARNAPGVRHVGDFGADALFELP